MNSAAKVQVRLLPTIIDYVEQTGKLPKGLVLAVAAFLAHEGLVKGCEKEAVMQACSQVVKEGVLAAKDQLMDGPPEIAMRGSGLLASTGPKAKSPSEIDMKSSFDFDA